MTIRVILVDDSRQVRETLRIILNQEPDIEIVGEAGSGWESLDVLKHLCIDVVIMDLNLPGIDGIKTAKQILDRWPCAEIIIVSLQSDSHYVRESLKAGAKGYVLKDCAFEELVVAVNIVVAGGVYISPKAEIAWP